MATNRDSSHQVDFPTIRQAARRSGLGENAIRELVRDGILRLYFGPTKRGRLYYAELVEYLRSTARTEPSEPTPPTSPSTETAAETAGRIISDMRRAS